jgi:TonB family protein
MNAEHRPSFTTAVQHASKTRAWPRFVGAGVVAVIALIVLALFGPEREEIRKRFEVYGAEGEIKLMPEISIDEGQDRVHQLPESFREAPPPNYQVEPDDPSPDAEREVPKAVTEALVTAEDESEFDVVDAETGEQDQVELTLPQQTSRDFRILELVRPVYPVGASASERRIPSVRVDAAIFVGTDGKVQAAMVTGGSGGPIFEEEVLRAVRQWLFEWIIDPPPSVGRWIEMSWRFKSPFAAP